MFYFVVSQKRYPMIAPATLRMRSSISQLPKVVISCKVSTRITDTVTQKNRRKKFLSFGNVFGSKNPKGMNITTLPIRLMALKVT